MRWSGDQAEAACPGDLLIGGEGDLHEAEGLQLAGPRQRAGVDGLEAAGVMTPARVDFASASSPAISTVVVSGPTVLAARVAAKVVLNAFRTRDCGRAVAISSVAELSDGTVRESKVSKFRGLVMSTTILPARLSPRSAITAATAG